MLRRNTWSSVEIIKGKRSTVKNQWGGLAKPRQPSDLPEKRGGYGYVRGLSSRDCGPSRSAHSYPSTVRLTGVAQGLNLREQSGNPEKHRNIEASEFGKSGILWTKDRQIHRGNPDELRVVHLLGQVAGIRGHQYIRGSEVKSPRPFDFPKQRRDHSRGSQVRHVPVGRSIEDLAIGVHRSE